LYYLELEPITIKIPKEMGKEIERILKPYYGTKTEFIREAIRDKLMELKREKAVTKKSKENLLNKRKND